MKTIRAVFHNGHLWDPNTSKRIVVRDKSEVIVTVSGDDAIHDVDPNNEPHKVIGTEEEQSLQMEAKRVSAHFKHEFFQYRKIMDRGQRLYFAINAGIRDKDKTERTKTYFVITLLEDLYIVRTKKADGLVKVEPCACVVEMHSGDQLPFFEPVYAFSLNDAYSKTFVLYFDIFGKATTNVYDSFYTELKHSSQYLLKRLRTFTE